MHDLQIQKDLVCKNLLIIDLLIHLDIFILKLFEFIAGGAILDERDLEMFDGESIIL
jgi:hypothetical protein